MPADPDLLTIGDFARAVGLPASALRHYDECGLLVPARTDAATGYRYYTPALERRARLVARMRAVGVPIEAMRLVLDGTPAQARGVLDGVAADREQQAQRTREALQAVLATLEDDRAATAVPVRLDGPVLAAALRQVRAAADVDATSALSAVALDARDGELDAVATNRHWMARRTLAVRGARGEARAVLRLGAVAALVDRLEAAGEVELLLAGDALQVDGAPVATSARPFPSYRLVVGALAGPAASALVHRADLTGAVERARRSVVAVRLGARADGGALEVAGAPVPAVVRGAPLEVRFRSALLLRAVGSCAGERVLLSGTAPDAPVVVTSPDQPGYAALVMPTLEPA